MAAGDAVARHGRTRVDRIQRMAFAAGIAVLFVALVGLHELSEKLLSAHMIQHELLMLVAAPLISFGFPLASGLWLVPASVRGRLIAGARRAGIVAVGGIVAAPAAVFLLHGCALWLWHLPALYQAALENETVHAAQHLSFFITAVLFWSGLLHGRYGRLGYGAAVVFVFATAVHSGLLGALLTLSRDLWYPVYASSSAELGLTPLEDQQLAGLVMWVPAGILLTIGGLAFLTAWVRESERRARFHVGPPAKATPLDNGLLLPVIAAAIAIASATAACSGGENERAAAALTGGDPHRGRAALHTYGCDSCHQIPGIRSSAGKVVGPPLTSMAARVYVAGHLPNTPATMQAWIRHPRTINPNTAMPDTGVTDSDSRDIAAYLYTLR
jgi:putative membrane protein